MTPQIQTDLLVDGGVTTAKIADANVTAAKLDGAQSGSAPIYGVRAWVNFNGTGTTGTNMAIRGSGNVTSVYKNSTGNYTITFTTAMPNANYAIVGTGSSTANAVAHSLKENESLARSTTTISVLTTRNSEIGDGYNDMTFVSVVVLC